MSEHDEQVAFFDWLRLNIKRLQPVAVNNCSVPSPNPELLKALDLCYAVPNGGQRHIMIAVKLKRAGVVRGFPDINLDYPSRDWHGLRMEMKFGTNTLTGYQQRKKELLESVGFKYKLCYQDRTAIETIINYLPFKRQDYVGV